MSTVPLSPAPMTWTLDARQRAMLEEMGVKVWWPLPGATESPALALEANAGRATTEDLQSGADRAANDEPPPSGVGLPERVSAPPTAAPPRSSRAALAATAPGSGTPAPAAKPANATLRLAAPQRLFASDAQSATRGWLVVADMPPAADGRPTDALADEAGRLLDQMLRALRLQAGVIPVHLLRVWRETGDASGAPLAVSDAQPPSNPAADFDSAFAECTAALAPRLVLALGPLAAQRLTGQAAPLGRLRGTVHRLDGVPLVVSYHPAYLLRNGADKARAWADLCLAAAQLDSAA